MPTIVNVDQSTLDALQLLDLDSKRIGWELPVGREVRLYKDGWEQRIHCTKIRRTDTPGQMELWTADGPDSYSIPLDYKREQDGEYIVQAMIAASSLA